MDLQHFVMKLFQCRTALLLGCEVGEGCAAAGYSRKLLHILEKKTLPGSDQLQMQPDPGAKQCSHMHRGNNAFIHSLWITHTHTNTLYTLFTGGLFISFFVSHSVFLLVNKAKVKRTTPHLSSISRSFSRTFCTSNLNSHQRCSKRQFPEMPCP